MNICHVCKKEIEKPKNKFATWYATDLYGNKVCYQCCADLDRQFMIDNGKIDLYLCKNENGHRVTDWAGKLSFPVRSMTTGRHNITKVRYDVWFLGPDDAVWHGTQYGNMTQVCHCRRTKQERPFWWY